MNLDFMAIGSHPDDVELSCAGTIIKLVKNGKKVGLVDLTEGELGTRGTAKIRAREAKNSAAIMGVTVRDNLRIPDGNIENTVGNRLKVIRLIRRYKPDVLIFPYSRDRHPDHENAHILCRESWFFAGLEKIVTTFDGKRQEPFRPRTWINFMQWHEFTPSFIVDVSGEYDQRMRAIRAFKSQFFDPDNRQRETVLSSPDFLEMVRTRAAYYGDRIGRKYGEPFFCPVPVGISDIDSLII